MLVLGLLRKNYKNPAGLVLSNENGARTIKKPSFILSVKRTSNGFFFSNWQLNKCKEHFFTTLDNKVDF